jgi:amino acid adenylation domain-containing protein
MTLKYHPQMSQGGHESEVVLLDGSGGSFTRSQLDSTIAQRSSSLTAAGAGGDVVALCLPSGTDLALNVLAAMKVGTAAPMGPSATEEECRAYLTDLRPRLLVTTAGSAAAAAASGLGIETLASEALTPVGAVVVEPTPPRPAGTALILPTSGTTGRPKLVPLSHANLAASAKNIAASLELTHDDRCLGLMPYYHIHGLVAGLLAPLAAGGSVIAAGGFDAARIRAWLQDGSPTWYTAVPTIHRAVLDALGQDRPVAHRLRFMRSSSSALAPQLMTELEEFFGAPAIEAYGMTEASHQMAINPLPPRPRRPGTVGVAFGTSVALLSDGVTHTEADRVGEVVIKGPGVLSEYRDNPAATAEAFHEGWFRTGDLGQLDDDGYLRLVGRVKEMINRGGEKIAPREVEEVLLAHPAVAQAVAFPCPHPTLGEDVAALVVARQGQTTSAAEIVRFAQGRLSPHKVPRRVIISDRIPLGPTGKPQRNRMAAQLRLAEPVAEDQAHGQRSALRAIWAEILRLEHVPSDVDFFALGGDSLRAMAMMSAVEERLGQAPPLSFLTEGTATLERMEGMLATPSPAAAAELPAEDTAVSYAEEAALLRANLDPDGALCNVTIGLRMRGELGSRRLEAALHSVVLAHEGLRTSYAKQGRTWKRLLSPSSALSLEVHDIQGADELGAALPSEARRPFDIEHGPLLRACVFTVGEAEYFVLITAHHSVMDGIARDLFLDALTAAYRDGPAALSPAASPVTGPGAIATSERARLAAGELEHQARYWRERLSPEPEPLELLGRPPRQDCAWAGDTVDFDLGEVTSAKLHEVARRERATPFAVILAGLVATLSRLSGSEDIVVGTPAANRQKRGTAQVIGMLANMLPLRVAMPVDATFADLIANTRAVVLGALVNQEYPYGQMLADAGPETALHLDPLFRVVCQLRDRLPSPDFGDGLVTEVVPVHPGTAMSDLSFDLRVGPSGIAGTVEFATSTFDRAQVEALCGYLRCLLAAAVTDVGQKLSLLPLVDDNELRKVLALGRGPEPVPAARNVVDVIVGQAQRTPGSPAVEAGSNVISYRELDLLTERVALALASRGVGRGAVVGVMPRRDERMVAVLLGILRAGAAYLALDPEYPGHRLQAMVGSVPLRLLLHAGDRPTFAPPGTELAAIDELLTVEPESSEMPPGPEPGDAACVLFTSGSTGQPKAVAITHASLVNLLSWTGRAFTTAELGCVPVTASLTFDYSLFEMYPPLAVGGRLVIVENVLALRDQPLAVTMIGTVPAALSPLLDDMAIPASARTIVTGGEALSDELAARVLALPHRPRLVNIYGPTETTVLCCASEVGPGDHPPALGQAIDGSVVLVMDRSGQPLPAGVPGELWVGGRGLSAGYMANPALTAERFVEADLPDLGRVAMYRTGDRVCMDGEGTFHFLGRLDNQLKVRGMRVEPGDIESTLVGHPAIGAAVVYAVPNEGTTELHAAIVASNGKIDIEDIRAFAELRLPRHMVPRRFRVVDQLPLTPHQKVDRRALAADSVAEGRRSTLAVRPAGAELGVEAILLSLWQGLLAAPELDIDSDFFAAGGHSLQALEMVIAAERQLDVRIPLAWLLDGPATVRRLTAQVQAAQVQAAQVHAARQAEPVARSPRSASPSLIPLRAVGHKPPLLFIYPDTATALAARSVLDTLRDDRPVYAFATLWDDVASLDDVVEQAASAIGASPEVGTGVLHIAGHSLGGLLAYELASRLEADGPRVGAVILVDTTVLPPTLPAPLRRRARMALGIPPFWRRAFWRPPQAAAAGRYHFPFDSVRGLVSRYQPTPLDRPVDLLTTAPSRLEYGVLLGWERVHRGRLTWSPLPGDHHSILHPPHANELGRSVDQCLDAAEADQRSLVR